MRQQGIVRPIIIAHSMGGRVTMRIATRNPELARAICFVDVAPIRSGDGGGTIREFMRRNVEFDRIEGVSSPRILEHVRQDQATLIKEAESQGFKLIEDKRFMKQNYSLRFAKQ